MLTANNYLIDRVRRVTQINLETGTVDWTGTSVESPQIEFTGEYTDKTDAYGVLLARFDTAKGVNFSGELSVLSMPLLASQRGTTVQIATEDTPLSGEDFEILTVTDGVATMSRTPSETPAYVYTITNDKNVDNTAMIEVGADTETQAQISGQEITVPTTYTGTQVGVYYKYETTSAVKVDDSSENFATAAKYIVDILAADVCNAASKRAGKLIFPQAKIDNNVTIDLTTEGTHPFSFTALKEYCADDALLCYWIWLD